MPPDPPSIEGPKGLRQIYPPVTLKYPLVQQLIETPDDVCKVLRTSAWLHSSDEPLTSEQLCLKFLPQISSLELVYERFKPLFPNHVNPFKLQMQYLSLVKFVHDCMGNAAASTMDPIELWQTLENIKGESFPEIFFVIEMCLCPPFSNATLERFFSHMGVVKTDWRNRLNEKSLEDNLSIDVAGPDLTKLSETYVAIAVAAWYNDKPRRMHQKKRKKYTQTKSDCFQEITC